MGKDISLHIINGNNLIAKDIFDGRDSEWFSKMSGNVRDDGDPYFYLPLTYGFPETNFPDALSEYATDRDYYDRRTLNVGKFKKWYNKYKPNWDAGWVQRYTAWKIENRNFDPEYGEDYWHDLDGMDNEFFHESDWIFSEFHIRDTSEWLYNYLIEHKIDDSYDLVYCFDC